MACDVLQDELNSSQLATDAQERGPSATHLGVPMLRAGHSTRYNSQAHNATGPKEAHARRAVVYSI